MSRNISGPSRWGGRTQVMAGGDRQTIIIGAGLSGLACAARLAEGGSPVVVLEASDAVGGRVRTDEVQTPEGTYLVDRGFQVLLTSYPTARQVLDFRALNLKAFYSGADVRWNGALHRVANPWKHPIDAARGFASPIATLGDKTRLADLYGVNRLTSLQTLVNKPEVQTIIMLRYLGFASSTIDRFFRAFFGGVFLERELLTSSRMFELVFRMFATGQAAVPADGMQRMPEQLAARLPTGTVRLNTRVRELCRDGEGWRVGLETGESIDADRVVVATSGTAATTLLAGAGCDDDRVSSINTNWVGTATLAYAMPEAHRPTDAPILVLDGDGTGPINHLAVMSNIAPSYAPRGYAMVYANTVGVPDVTNEQLDMAARRQLDGWFGDRVRSWRLLRVVRVPMALPDQRVVDARERVPSQSRAGLVGPGLYICGDHTTWASIDGALSSGLLVAEALLRHASSHPDR